MREANKVEFNPYIYTTSKLSRFGYELSVFLIHNRTVFKTAGGTAGVVLQTIPLQTFLPLRLVWLLVCCLYKEVYLQIFKSVSF